MIRHLTQKDIERYVEDLEPDEEYLEWYEEVSPHVSECEVCRELIRKQMMVELISEPDGTVLAYGLKELAKEKKVTPIGEWGGSNGWDIAAANRPSMPAASIPPAAASISTPQPPQIPTPSPESESKKKKARKKGFMQKLFKKDDKKD